MDDKFVRIYENTGNEYQGKVVVLKFKSKRFGEDYKDATEQEIKEDAYYYFGSGDDIKDLGESKSLELYIGRLLLETDGDIKKAIDEYTEDLSHENIEDCYEGEKAVYNRLIDIFEGFTNGELEEDIER